MFLIPIKYHGLEYPTNINCIINEVAGHFDKTCIPNGISTNEFSLHTEYSAKKRNLDSILIRRYNELINFKTGNNKPKLWKNSSWAQQFAEFVISFCIDVHPKIIEIHPPNTRLICLEDFFSMYNIFYQLIKSRYPNTEILIENRNSFLLSGIDDFKLFSNYIDHNNINLKFILDFPQLLNYENARNNENRLNNILNEITFFKHNIRAFHIWGQTNNIPHRGDMSDYFEGNINLENLFFEKISNLFIDENKNFYFIPEINSGVNGKSKEECLNNIINKLINVGFRFI